MRILIVEDDRDLAAALDDALRYEGYATLVASTGVDALHALANTHVDIVLLDRDLPVLSGDTVMETIAANRIPVAVIMLTAASGIDDRVTGLDLGADDYLTKPFAYPELLARIRALGRRGGGNATGAVSVLTRGDVTLDVTRRLVFRDHGRTLIKCTPKEYGVLLELMLADGGYVGVRDLYDAVWDDAAAEPADAVKTTVYSLRGKLGDRGLIVSARGEGYRMR